MALPGSSATRPNRCGKRGVETPTLPANLLEDVWKLNSGAPVPALSSKGERDHSLLLTLLVVHYSMIPASLLYARIAVF